MQLKNIAVLGASVAIAAVGIGIGAGGSAYADSLIGSAGIRDNSVRSVDVHDGGIKRVDLSDSINRSLAKHGEDGLDGKDGVDGKGRQGRLPAPSTPPRDAGYTDRPIATVACDHDLRANRDHGGPCRSARLDAEANGGEHARVVVVPRSQLHGLAARTRPVTVTWTAGSYVRQQRRNSIRQQDRSSSRCGLVRAYHNLRRGGRSSLVGCAPLG